MFLEKRVVGTQHRFFSSEIGDPKQSLREFD